MDTLGSTVIDKRRAMGASHMIWQNRNIGDALIALVVTAVLPVPAHGQTYDTAYQAYLVQDYKTARKELEALGESITPEGKYLLGSEYIQGQGGQHRIDQGIKLIRDAAAAGSPSAMFYLGKTFVDGDHRYSSADEARAYLTSLASTGNADAKTLLARLSPGSPEPVPLPGTVAGAGSADASTSADSATSSVGGNQGETATPEQEAPPVDLLKDIRPNDTTPTSNLILPEITTVTRHQKIGPKTAGLAAAAIGIAILIYLFSGVKCPGCGKRRVSEIVSQKQLGQFTRPKKLTIKEDATYLSSSRSGFKTGSSHKTREHYVNVTVREFLKYYRCKNCGHDFQLQVEQEM